MADDERIDAEKARENSHEPVAPEDEVLAAALERFPEAVAHDSRGQPTVHLRSGQWHDFALWLRDEQQFEVCVDVCGVDHLLNRGRQVPAGVRAERFEVVGNFLSRSRRRRVRAVCQVPVADPVVPSLADVYPGVEWPERETYDLFGIRFDGHPDLTRILLPDDWQGYPLRKDDAAARVPVQFKGPSTTPFQQAPGRESSGGAGSQP